MNNIDTIAEDEIFPIGYNPGSLLLFMAIGLIFSGVIIYGLEYRAYESAFVTNESEALKKAKAGIAEVDMMIIEARERLAKEAYKNQRGC